jgi:hypothetical protein
VKWKGRCDVQSRWGGWRMEGEKATATDVDNDLTVRVPGGDVRPIVEKTGTKHEVAVRQKGGPLLLKEPTEEHSYTSSYNWSSWSSYSDPRPEQAWWAVGRGYVAYS